ncbi:MAG TPA: hypothetical protein VKP14_10605 [Gaiellaceae bacterium]|nr:hypothetical protein [Gaiellaceae bacterium]
MRGGVDGNERLTAASGVILVVLLAAEGVTILSIRQLVSAHVFIGMLLIPPTALKLGTTGWRFVRYYAGAREYREKGAPLLPLRLLAPLVVAATVAVFATGVALIVVGPQNGFLLGLHKASFVVWFAATGLHVLAYVRRVPALAVADWRRRVASVDGAFARRLVLAAVLVAGAILAVATVRYAQPWVHFRGGDG